MPIRLGKRRKLDDSSVTVQPDSAISTEICRFSKNLEFKNVRARSRSFTMDDIKPLVVKDEQVTAAAKPARNERHIDVHEPVLIDFEISASGTDDESIHSSDLESIPELDNSQSDSDNDEAVADGIPTLTSQEIADFQVFKQQYLALRQAQAALQAA